MKATWCQVNGEGREIFKDPKTDDGVKKSLKGLICVTGGLKGAEYKAVDQASKEQEAIGCLETVFEDGKLIREFSLEEVRRNLNATIQP